MQSLKLLTRSRVGTAYIDSYNLYDLRYYRITPRQRNVVPSYTDARARVGYLV